MDEKLKQLLQDYVSTANSGKYKTMDEVYSKFPELKDYSIDLLNDYVATANSGKYSSIDEVNARFPEFGPKQAEVSPQGSGLTSQELGEPTMNTNNPEQNLGLPGQSMQAPNTTSLDQSLLARSATNLEDVITPQGTQVIEGLTNEYGLPVYANVNEDGTYSEAGSFLEPVELKANRSQAMAQNQRIAAEDLSTWESTKNSFKNMYKQLQGFDKRLTIMSADIYKKVLGKDLAKSFYELSDRDIDQEIATAYQQLDAINESMNPTLGFTDGDAIAGVANAVTSFASTALSSAATLGAGLVTEMVGGSLYDYNKAKAESLGISVEELYKQGKEDFWTPAAVGAAASALERIGLKGATRAIMTNITGKTARQFAILGWEVNKEGMTEWIQTGLSAYNEAIAQGKSQADALADLGYAMGSKEGLESYLQGLAGSAAATAGGRAAKGFFNKSKGQKFADNNSKIQSLLVDYANANDPVIKDIFLDTAVELVEGNSALESENVAEIEAVPQNVRAEVVSSQMEIDALNEAVETGNVSDSSKAAIEAKVQDLESNKEAIIKENTVGTTVKDAISKPDGRYILDGEDGTISVDEGGKVTFETENKVVELGNVDSVSDNDLSSFGIDVEREIPVSIDGNKINIDGVEYVNNFSDPVSAINRDSDGRVISINLETPDGKKRTIRGQRADAIAYEYQNLQNENTETEIEYEIVEENNVVPVESDNKQETVATQELVEPNVEINETIQETNPATEVVSTEVESENQNVAVEPEQITEVESNVEANEIQENPVQENEQTEVREEVEQESTESTEMPDVDQTNPRLKSVLKSIPNQDVESLVGPANVEKRRDIIEAITGKRPAKNNAGINATRKAVDDYFGLTGDNASKASKLRNWTNFEQTDFSNEEEASIYQIRNTEDPNEILDIYDTDVDNLDYKQSAIADYASKINLRDYARYGDLNNLQGNRGLRRWVDSKNSQTVGLDVMAEELSDQIGVEVTPQDFIDFIENYSSAQDFRDANKSNVKIEAENRYKELTGRNITENALERRRAARSEESANAQREAVNRDNMAAIGLTDTEVADRQNMESEQEKVARQKEKQTSDRTPVSLLDGVSQKVKQAGLANSIKLRSSDDISADGYDGPRVNGYVDKDGNIVINRDTAGLDVPIHEVGHVWLSKMKSDNNGLYQQGIDLIKSAEGDDYVLHVMDTQPGLTGDAIYEEALVQAIGDSGARLIKTQERSKITEWLKAAWDYIGGLVGISDKTMEQVANMTLREYTDGVAIDLLSGKPIKTTLRGDVFVEMNKVSTDGEKVDPAPVTKASEMNVDQKKIAAFMEKMRLRNTVKYQGTVDPSSLSDSDLVEFVDVAQSLMNLGEVQSYSDLKSFASSLGIENESQIKFVWNSVNQKKVLGIKKALVDPKKVLETKYDKLSDAEYLEMGKQMVDSGLIVPSELLSDVLATGRVLEPYEVTALIYGRTLDQKRIDELGVMITTLEGDELSNARVEMEALFDKIADYETMMLMTATAQSAAFRLRSVMTDKEYNVQRYIAEMEAMGELSPDVRAELEALGREMESVKSELRNKVAELEDLKKKQSQTNINKAAKKKPTPAPKPRNTAKKNEYTKDALDIIAGLNISDYGLPGVSFQINGNVKFSINSSNPLLTAIQDALSSIQDAVSSKSVRLDDAVESAIAQINSAVGKGNWNEIKFRSDILNQYVNKGHVVLAKRPYVGTDGKLVVPTAYLKEIVADYQSNNSGEMSIEDMVDAVMDEVGSGFNRRDALEAVSRFGIVSANTRSEEIANIQRARTIGNLLAELEDLEKGIPRRLKKKAGPKNTRAEELRKQIHDIEESMRMTPEERAQMRQDKALEAKKRYMKEYIDKIDNKISNKDFEPEVKTPLYDFSNHPDIIDLEKRREDIKNKFKAAKFKHKLENRTPGEKLGDLAIDVFFNTTRALSAGTDISSFLVQGGLITFSNPVTSAKSLKKSMGVVKSEESFDDYFAGLQRDPLFEAARKAKLNMQLPNFYQSVVEEQIPGGQNLVVRGYDFLVDKFVTNKNIAKKLKDWFPMTAAERQYAVFLSDIRFNMFKQVSMDAINYQGLDVTSKEGQVRLAEIADAVNNITMAANIKTLDGATKIQKYLNLVLFSARKLAATIKLLYKIPYYGVRRSQNIVGRITGNASLTNKTEFDALIFDKVYGQAAKGLANMAAVVIIPTLLANWSYDEDEDEEPPLLYNPHVLNPIHSDFLKMKIGDTRYSPFLGIEGNIGLISRLVSGEYMTSSSSQVLKTGEKSPNGMGENKSELDLVAQFLKNKLAPTPSIALGYFGNSRERREAGSRFVESFAPMWSTGIYEDVTENNKPMSEALAYGALGILGMSFNTYGGAEYASAKGTNNKEAYNIMRKVGISDYIPDARDKKSGMYDNGSYIAELDNKKFKDEYVPAYNEFMTKSTIVNGSKLLGDKLSIDSKDGLLLQMKKEAYNYAELKSTGVIVDSYFNTFNHTDDEGVSTKYKITRAQYPEKVSLIKNILAGKDDDYLIDSYVKQDIRDEVISKMDKDGLKRDKDYINMQVEIQLFRLANRYANEKLAENFKPGKYIPSQSYDPNVHEEEQFRD